MTTRRDFLKFGAMAGAGLLVPLKFGARRGLASTQIPQIPVAGKAIRKYVDALPTFVGNRIDGTSALTVTMQEFQQNVLPAAFYAGLPAPYNAGTYVWGYGISAGATTYGPLYPAFTIEAKRGISTTATYVNNLGTDTVPPVLQQYFTIDQTLHWADPLMQHHMHPMTPYAGPAPAVVHLHGGEVPSEFDGGPDSWFTPGLYYSGPGFVSDTYTYPNAQEAATLWFHDHTLGATRLNVYAGLAGFYFLRDSRDTGLPDNPIGLPTGPQEIEIVIQDRMFDTNGQLLFPDVGINPMDHPFWLPEFFGDVIVVNGKTWPFLNVEPRRYRFRFLDGSNARFYELRLMNRATKVPGPAFWQIGTDGGLLDVPVKLNDPAILKAPRLLLAPGERADIIIDFAGYQGQTLTLLNSAKAPFPKGAAPDTQTIGQIMEFRVGTGIVVDNSYDPATGAPLRTPMIRLANPVTGTLAAGVTPHVTRQLTLNEVMGMGGPLEVLVNNTKWDGTMSPNAGGVTETPRVGSTEVWEIVNLTADAHPIHLHLVQFQLVSRQAFNVTQYLATYNAGFPGGVSPVDGLTYAPGVFIPGYGPPSPYASTAKLGGNPDVARFLQGLPKLPNPNEAGWKDTVVMYPGEVTRIVVRWAPQDSVVTGVGAPAPGVNQYPFDPTTGPGYVWHCHIIDHEDNEMMRPQQVQP